jgi:hypothetical protein
MLFELIGDALPLLGIRGRGFFGRDIGPNLCIFGINAKPAFDAGLGIGLDRLDGAFRLADPTIDAFIRMDDQHVLALVKAIYGADFDAIHVFAFDAIVVDDIGHFHTLDGLFVASLLSHGSDARKKNESSELLIDRLI